MHELGFRTLLVLNWPGHVPAQVIDDLVSTVDLFPTLLDLAGLSPPGGRTGRSLRPLLAGARGDPGRRVIGHAYPLRGGTESVETFFLRTAEWHYVSSPTRPEADELYHVTSDPEEAENLVAAEPALVEAFRRAIAAWRAEMDRLRDRGVRARRSSS
jgi:arylsulfatase A-like enzyme